ncbi:MAG: HD-GYP domain-containing protein [Thermodesulfobacteriota bacterium]
MAHKAVDSKRVKTSPGDLKSRIFQQRLSTKEIIFIPGFEEEGGYAPLPLRNITVGWEAPFDIFLKIQMKGETTPQFIMGCARGEVFQEDWHAKLVELDIPCVYVSLKDMDRLMHYLQYNLKLLLADHSHSDLEKSLRIADATHLWTLNFFNSEIARTGDQVKLALKFLGTLLEVVQDDRHNNLHLVEIRRHSFRLYTHCLNVCLLGLAFTSYLNWSVEDIRGFGLGALIHDIGLIRTPVAILDKKGKLGDEEMNKVKRHPLDGFRMMQSFLHVRWEALKMVLQHHENGDGSGYPQGLKIHGIHPWSRILRILDSYEAMTAARPWRPAMEPKEALWIMRTEWEESKLFDHNFLTTFVKFLAGH